MNFNLMHPADQIVTIMNRLYSYGMTTTSGGNLSIMDSEGTVWISPSGVDKGTLRREDIMQIRPSGEIVGIHTPSVEYPFHLSVYRVRPDLKAVLHAHPPALVALSVVRKIPETAMIPQSKVLCGDIRFAQYAVPGSQQLGKYISAQFEAGIDTVMLENHGVVIGAENLFAAFMKFEMLEFCAQLEINVSTLDKSSMRTLSDKYMAIYKQKAAPHMDEYIHSQYTSEELEIRQNMCRFVKRSYDNRLFTSGQGTFSHRLKDGSFIITPYKMDRKYLEPGDLVRIDDGRKEQGKNPSRSVALHEKIYASCPEINSIIIAQPPHIMAFAATDAEFDARLIPESYIQLKTVRKFPFGSSFMQPELVAKELSLKDPVLIVENDCVITCGHSLLNAFDRLEVMEYSAKSVIDAKRLGREVVKITPEEVREIEIAFNL